MTDVRVKRVSGIVWASLAYLVCLPIMYGVASILTEFVATWFTTFEILVLRDSNYIMHPGASRGGFPVWLAWAGWIVTPLAGVTLAVCVGLWVYHRMVYRDAFKRLELENVDAD